jgi:N-acetylmuramoyl-L-alanine amidase
MISSKGVLNNSNITSSKNIIESSVLNDNVSDGIPKFSDVYKDKLKIKSKSDIIVVVDPGHGSSIGNTGAYFRKAYKHYIKSDNGNYKLNTDGSKIIVESNVPNLPDYVFAELKGKAGFNKGKWVISEIIDSTKSERNIVWRTGLALVDKLKLLGYTVFKTRENEFIDGADERTERSKFTNSKGAHYFISIHADGLIDYTKSGAHSIYRTSINNTIYNAAQKEFAIDIFSYYNILPILNISPKIDNNLGVINPSVNHAYRKVLLELGFITCDFDNRMMDSSIDKIADQIAQGLEKNVNKSYEIIK